MKVTFPKSLWIFRSHLKRKPNSRGTQAVAPSHLGKKKKKSRLEWGCGRDGQKKKGGKSCETCFGRPGLPSPSICVPYCADPVFDVFPESRDIILSPTAPEPTNRETARPGHRPPAGWPRKWSRCPDALGPGALPLWTPARLDPRCPTDGS